MREENDWLLPLLAGVLGGLAGFVIGTRAGGGGGYCEVNRHWWFGWWVRCTGGERCASGECVLLRRRRGSEENWSEVDVAPGGSVRWNPEMEYRCSCR